MRLTSYAYVNGRFVPETEAHISIFDAGFLYGDGVFETMRVYAGKMFRPLEHFERLFAGLAALEIESPFSPDELRTVCRALIRYNGIADGVARVYLTRDSIVATAAEREFAAHPLRAIVSDVCVDSNLSRFKTANRLPYILAHQQAERVGANEAVLLNAAGRVVEFTTSNLFVVKGGALFTPPLEDGALAGITRHAALASAGELRIETHETGFAPASLETADEVFATNSLIEIVPVETWGTRREITERLQKAYARLVRDELSILSP